MDEQLEYIVTLEDEVARLLSRIDDLEKQLHRSQYIGEHAHLMQMIRMRDQDIKRLESELDDLQGQLHDRKSKTEG